MGHLTGKGVYHHLQHRLDRYPVGAPAARELYEILKLLFSEEEAAVAARMPMAPETLKNIARSTRVEPGLLETVLKHMAGKGLVMDFVHPKTGTVYYMLSPTVVGFFEFSLMRVRSDFPQKKVAQLMHDYMFETPIFARDVFQGTTQIGRTLVHEAALPEDVPEILDYEKASAIIADSTSQAVSLCYCRHKQKLTGEECKYPLEICSSFNDGAEYLIRNKLARRSSKGEMRDILDQTYELGLVNIADNVQKEPSYICRCCSCCCGMLVAIRRFRMPKAVMTSSYVAGVDRSKCRGCKRCAAACPVEAIKIKVIKRSDRKKKYRWAEVDKNACLGCGVCVGVCDKNFAISMLPRKQRVIPPLDTYERVLTMALERGKLHEYLFDGDDPPVPTALHGVVKAMLALPLTKQLLLQKQLKSRFIRFLIDKSQPAQGGVV